MPHPPTPREIAAFREAGRALASVLAFRAIGSGRRAINFVDITEGKTPEHRWRGRCHGQDIYSPAWPGTRIAPQHRRRMEWQIVVDLAGPIAEAVRRGERRKKHIGAFALFDCSSRDNYSHAGKILADVCTLTNRRHALQRFEQRTLGLVLAHWRAIETLAIRLIDAGRLDGDQAEQIVTARLPRRDNQAGMISTNSSGIS
jgi:hypothetical protein